MALHKVSLKSASGNAPTAWKGYVLDVLLSKEINADCQVHMFLPVSVDSGESSPAARGHICDSEQSYGQRVTQYGCWVR